MNKFDEERPKLLEILEKMNRIALVNDRGESFYAGEDYARLQCAIEIVYRLVQPDSDEREKFDIAEY